MINDLSKPGLIARKIEDEGLVEDRVQRSLLHVRLLLWDPLTIVHQVDLHVRICKKYFRFLYIFLHFFWPFWMLDYWKTDTGSNFIKKNCISLDPSSGGFGMSFFACFFLTFSYVSLLILMLSGVVFMRLRRKCAEYQFTRDGCHCQRLPRTLYSDSDKRR